VMQRVARICQRQLILVLVLFVHLFGKGFIWELVAQVVIMDLVSFPPN